MTLKEYMVLHGLTAKYLALRLDVSVSAARKWIQGTRIPRLSAMKKINRITSGKVSFNDWR